MSISQIVGSILIAIVGGVIGAYLKPQAEHHFSEIKIREQQRRELLSRWRAQIYEAYANQKAWVAGDTRVEDPPEDFYGHAWFENLRHYLADDTGSIDRLPNDVKTILNVPGTLMTEENLRLLNDEINRLSREWHLSAKGRRRLFGFWF